MKTMKISKPYIRSTEKPLKSRKEKKVGIDLKPPTGELVSPTPEYLRGKSRQNDD